MVYNTALEQRIDTAIAGWGLDIAKKKLFGGIGYLLNGNMAFGVRGDELLVRTSEVEGEEFLKHPGVRNFEMGGRTSMKNWHLAGGEAIANETRLAKLLEMGRDFALTLPPKR